MSGDYEKLLMVVNAFMSATSMMYVCIEVNIISPALRSFDSYFCGHDNGGFTINLNGVCMHYLESWNS